MKCAAILLSISHERKLARFFEISILERRGGTKPPAKMRPWSMCSCFFAILAPYRRGRCARTACFFPDSCRAGTGAVDVQKLRVFCDSCRARAKLWGSMRAMCKNRMIFLRFWCTRNRARATLCGDRACQTARYVPVQIFALRARATLCGDCASQIARAVVSCESSRIFATVCRDQAAKSQLLSTKVVRKVRPPQLRLQSRNF